MAFLSPQKMNKDFCLVFTVTDEVQNLINALEPLKVMGLKTPDFLSV